MKAFKKAIMKEWWNNNLDRLPLGAKWRGQWHKCQIKRIIKEIDERKLDIEIAEKVFCSKVKVLEKTEYREFGSEDIPELQMCVEVHKNGSWDGKSDWEEYDLLPHYSTDIKDAWKCLKADKIALSKIEIYYNYYDEPISVVLINDVDVYSAEGNTESETICLAALKVVNAK